MIFKLLFYVLALLNIAYLFWQFHLGRINPAQPVSDNQSSIMLVGEYLRAQRGADISAILQKHIHSWQQAELEWMLESVQYADWQRKGYSTRSGGGSVVTSGETGFFIAPGWQSKRRCYQRGPFADQGQLQQWLDSVVIKQAQVFRQDISVERDFQVYYPAAKSSAQSLLDNATLLEKEYPDIWKISDGELKGAYSLGIFREKQRAIALKNQLAGKNIKAEIYPRKAIVAQWFARIWPDEREAVDIKGFTDCSAR